MVNLLRASQYPGLPVEHVGEDRVENVVEGDPVGKLNQRQVDLLCRVEHGLGKCVEISAEFDRDRGHPPLVKGHRQRA